MGNAWSVLNHFAGACENGVKMVWRSQETVNRQSILSVKLAISNGLGYTLFKNLPTIGH